MVEIETKRRYDDIFSFLFKVEQNIFDRLHGKTCDFFTVRDASFIAICLSKASRKSQRSNRVVEVFIASIKFLRVRDKQCLKRDELGSLIRKPVVGVFSIFLDANTTRPRNLASVDSSVLDIRFSRDTWIFDLVSFDRLTLFNVITLIRRV